MSKQIIGIDIDGVLANFNEAYRERLISVTGRDLIPKEVCRSAAPGEEPPCWDYAPFFGYTKEEDRATWASIIANPNFWRSLNALPNADQFLWPIGNHPDLYFITTRPGVDTKRQSASWLMMHGIDYPAVLIARTSEDKGVLAKGLGLTHFLDDKPENCLAVKEQVPTCAVYLLSCKYNEWAHNDVRYAGVLRIHSLSEFEEALRGRAIDAAA